MKPWRTLSRTVLFKQTPWITLESHRIELPDGRQLEDWIWINSPDFVIVAAVDQQNRFLVFEQTKYAANGLTLAPVGGVRNPDEDPLSAAKRELLEETGYESDHWVDLGSFMTDSNRGNGRGYYFLALDAKPSGRGARSDDLEEQELHFFSPQELADALDNNRVQIITWQACLTMALMRLSKT